MSINIYPSIAKVKRNGVYENLPGFVQQSGNADIEAMIATKESDTLAQYSHPQGSYFILNDILYQADIDIPVSGTIAVGTNCHVAVLADDVAKNENDVKDLKSSITFVEKGTGAIEAKEHAGYILTSGNWEGTSAYHSLYTDIIPCIPNDVFWYQGSANNPIMFYVDGIYNSRMVISRQIAPIKITIPSGINGVRFSSTAPNGTEVVFSAYKDGSNYDLICKETWKTNKLNSTYAKSESTGYAIGYNNNTGTVSYEGTSSYHNYTTVPIPCVPEDKFYYKGKGVSQNSAFFFDETMTFVSKIGYSSDDKYTEITIPSDISYVIFTSYAPNGSDIIFDLYADGSNKQIALGISNIAPDVTALTNAKLNAVMAGEPLGTFVVDGIMGTNGDFSSTSSFNSTVTDYIKCKVGDIFTYYGLTSNSVVACMWYTADKSVLSYERPGSGNYLQTTFTAPTNAEYVRFTSYNSKPYIPGLWVSMKTTYESPLTGKTWYPCGDSFTAGDFGSMEGTQLTSGRYIGKVKSYPYLIGNRTNANIKRASVSGETIAAYSGGTVVFSDENYQYGYKSVGTDADYITLWFGINDNGHNIAIGTIDDTDNSTFYGAWNVVLDDFTTRCTKAHIGIVISNNLSSEYVDAVIAVAKKWGIPYLDLNYDNQIPLMHYSLRPDASATIKAKRNAQFAISESNHHPNLLAHDYESYFIEKWLLTL